MIQVKTTGLTLFTLEDKGNPKTKNPKVKKTKEINDSEIKPLTLF
jgi:hypothetical protein